MKRLVYDWIVKISPFFMRHRGLFVRVEPVRFLQVMRFISKEIHLKIMIQRLLWSHDSAFGFSDLPHFFTGHNLRLFWKQSSF